MIQLYIVFVVLFAVASAFLFLEADNPKWGARVLLCSLVWPLALVVLFFVGLGKLLVLSEWVPDMKDTKETHLHDPRFLPNENGGQRRASCPVEAKPMTKIPMPPKK